MKTHYHCMQSINISAITILVTHFSTNIPNDRHWEVIAKHRALDGLEDSQWGSGHCSQELEATAIQVALPAAGGCEVGDPCSKQFDRSGHRVDEKHSACRDGHISRITPYWNWSTVPSTAIMPRTHSPHYNAAFFSLFRFRNYCRVFVFRFFTPYTVAFFRLMEQKMWFIGKINSVDVHGWHCRINSSVRRRYAVVRTCAETSRLLRSSVRGNVRWTVV